MSVWFISDTHFGDAEFLGYVNAEGARIRPFASVEEMDELMIARWNECVRPSDKIYHLGDFCLGDPAPYLARLNGKKRLVVGNHDDIKALAQLVPEIMMWRRFGPEKFVCTHVPIHKESFAGTKLNVHGHIHHHPSPDECYLNVSVEAVGYRPVHMDEIKQTISDRGL